MIDHIRDRHPDLGLAVYAYEPGGVVTVEVLTPDGSRFTKQAPTMQEALAALFGPMPEEPEPIEAEEEPDVFS